MPPGPWVQRLLPLRSVLTQGLRWGAGAAIAATVGASLALPAHRWFLLIYIAPLLLAGAYWANLRLTHLEALTDSLLVLEVVVFLAAGLRLFGGWGVLPYSGHMLFLTYSIGATARPTVRLALATLLIMTTIYKLGYSHDPLSWGWGLGLGLLASGVRIYLSRLQAVA